MEVAFIAAQTFWTIFWNWTATLCQIFGILDICAGRQALLWLLCSLLNEFNQPFNYLGGDRTFHLCVLHINGKAFIWLLEPGQVSAAIIFAAHGRLRAHARHPPNGDGNTKRILPSGGRYTEIASE
jgi:hypothetical protein